MRSRHVDFQLHPRIADAYSEESGKAADDGRGGWHRDLQRMPQELPELLWIALQLRQLPELQGIALQLRQLLKLQGIAFQPQQLPVPH